MDLLEAAVAFAKIGYEGERLKYVEGIYFDHPKDVSERMHTKDEKVVALLHDYTELRVKRDRPLSEELQAREAALEDFIDEYEKKKKPGTLPDPADLELIKMMSEDLERRIKQEQKIPLDRKIEEAIIENVLKEIHAYFKNCGYDTRHLDPDLRAVTKFTSDYDYKLYIIRLADDAEKRGCLTAVKVKMADLEDNSRPDRNPPFSSQTEKDRARLARYKWALEYLKDRFPPSRFPEVRLRPAEEDKPDYKLGRRGRLSARDRRLQRQALAA